MSVKDFIKTYGRQPDLMELFVFHEYTELIKKGR